MTGKKTTSKKTATKPVEGKVVSKQSEKSLPAKRPQTQMVAPATTPMDLIAKAIEKGADIEYLTGLMDLQERWEANQASKAYNAALARFQAECPIVPKTKKVHDKHGTYRYSYTPYGTLMKFIRPYLCNNGFSVSTTSRIEDGIAYAISTIRHEAGHSEISEFSIPVDPDMYANDSQKVASANSYAKRYAVSNGLDIVTEGEDDDGETGGGAGHEIVTITDDQAADLEALIESSGKTKMAFLKWAQVDSLDKIPASWWDDIVKMLEKHARNQ